MKKREKRERMEKRVWREIIFYDELSEASRFYIINQMYYARSLWNYCITLVNYLDDLRKYGVNVNNVYRREGIWRFIKDTIPQKMLKSEML